MSLFVLFALITLSFGSPAVDFFEGFISVCSGSSNLLSNHSQGIGGEISQDPAVCVNDTGFVLTDFEEGYATIKAGVLRLDVRQVEKGLLEWSKGVAMIATTLRDCGAHKLCM